MAKIKKLEENNLYKNRTEIISRHTGKKYILSIRKSDERWCCACPDWIMRRQHNGEDCKHLKEFKNDIIAAFGGAASPVTQQGTLFDVLKGLLNLSGRALINQWMENKLKAELMKEYLALTDGGEKYQEYMVIYNDLQTKIVASMGI